MSAIIPPAPCIDAPFRLDGDGQLVTVPAGSQEEINAQIYNVLTCPQGAKFGDPDFGIPFLPGQALPLNLVPVVQAIQDQVSAAVDVSAVEAAILATRPQSTQVDIAAEIVTSA
jgi:hypothetical protein